MKLKRDISNGRIPLSREPTFSQPERKVKLSLHSYWNSINTIWLRIIKLNITYQHLLRYHFDNYYSQLICQKLLAKSPPKNTLFHKWEQILFHPERMEMNNRMPFAIRPISLSAKLPAICIGGGGYNSSVKGGGSCCPFNSPISAGQFHMFSKPLLSFMRYIDRWKFSYVSTRQQPTKQ